jgi:trigger factor
VAEPQTTPADTEHDHDHDHAGHDHGPGGHHHTVNATLEDLGPCKQIMKVSVPAAEVKKEIEDQLNDVRKTARIKGFRPGKVPMDMVRKLYGQPVQDEVKKHLLEHAYFQALKDKKVQPENILGESRVENMKFSPEEGLSFEVTIQLRPKFELPEYKHVHVELPKLKVTDEDVEKALEGFRRARGEIRPVEDAKAVVEAEDFLSCDVEIWLADEWENKQDESDEKPAGSTSVKPLKEMKDVEVHVAVDKVGDLDVDDLQDSMVGLSLGEWGEVETSLPNDYAVMEGRGQAAIVRLKINSIKRLFLPPLTDEWVKESGYDSVEDLRREAREDIFRRKELARQSEVETRVLDKILDKIGHFDLPADLIEAENADATRRRELELRYEGKTEEEAKGVVQGEEQELQSKVLQNLRYFFVLDEVAKKEKIRVTEADIEARISRIAQSAGRTPAEIRKHFEERKVLPQLRHEIQNEKTRAFLRENAKIADRED